MSTTSCLVLPGIQAFAGDLGLVADTLVRIELFDWCAFETSARWALEAVRRAHPVLRKEICKAGKEISKVGLLNNMRFEFCRENDITHLWAALDESGSLLVAPEGVVIRDEARRDSLLHVALANRGKNADKQVAWLLSRPGACRASQALNLARQTALHFCARYGKYKAARHILKFPGVHVDATDHYETTPLIEAVREEHPAMVRELLKARANPNAFVPNCHGHGDTPLILAVRLRNEELVRLLLEAPGINVHQKSIIDVPFGKDALDFAPEKGRLRVALEEFVAHQKECQDARPQPLDDQVTAPELNMDKMVMGSKDSHSLNTCCGDGLTGLKMVLRVTTSRLSDKMLL